MTWKWKWNMSGYRRPVPTVNHLAMRQLCARERTPGKRKMQQQRAMRLPRQPWRIWRGPNGWRRTLWTSLSLQSRMQRQQQLRMPTLWRLLPQRQRSTKGGETVDKGSAEAQRLAETPKAEYIRHMDGQVEEDSESELEMEEENDDHRFKPFGLGGIGKRLPTVKENLLHAPLQDHSLTFGIAEESSVPEEQACQDNVNSSEIHGIHPTPPVQNVDDRNYSGAIPVPERIALDNPEWSEKISTYQRKNAKKKAKETTSTAHRRSHRFQEGNTTTS